MPEITSLDNDRVRRVLALQRSTRRRLSDGLMVAEGLRLTRELAQTPLPIVETFHTSGFAANPTGRQILALLQERGPCYSVPDELFREMSDTETPQGILVVLPVPVIQPPHEAPFHLVLDGLREPGNVGTILRTAWAAGVPLVLLAPGTVDFTNPKVVRAGMGAHFHVPLRRATWPEIQGALGGRALWLAAAGNGTPYFEVDWTSGSLLVIGGEAAGAAEEARRLARGRTVTIPMVRGVDSLSVGAAAAVILFEVARQRRCLDGSKAG